MISNLHRQLEENKRTLQTSSEIQKIISFTQSTVIEEEKTVQQSNRSADHASSEQKNLQAPQHLETHTSVGFKGKKQLYIDTDMINQEQEVGGNADAKQTDQPLLSGKSEGRTGDPRLTQMRLVMGSEKLVRQNSGCSPKGLISPK